MEYGAHIDSMRSFMLEININFFVAVSTVLIIYYGIWSSYRFNA